MSRRLTEQDKARIIEQSTTELENQCFFINPTDGAEFHEGMAAGILVATEIIQKEGELNAISAAMLIATVSRCIKEST